MKPFVVVDLHGEPSSETLRIDELAVYLQTKFPHVSVAKHADLVAELLQSLPEAKRGAVLDGLAVAFAKARVHDPMKPVQEREPLYGEVAYELRRLSSSRKQPFGVVYDGFLIQAALRDLMLTLKRSHVLISFTNQLLATFSEDDKRYHLRTIILGYPAIISTTGLVEAPAKPPQFYLMREQARSAGMTDVHAALEQAFKDRCLLHNDERLTQVAKGYVLQAAFYALFGEAFCPDPDCRLYNAHWQEEMLHAQLDGDYEICPRHEEMLKLFD